MHKRAEFEKEIGGQEARSRQKKNQEWEKLRTMSS